MEHKVQEKPHTTTEDSNEKKTKDLKSYLGVPMLRSLSGSVWTGSDAEHDSEVSGVPVPDALDPILMFSRLLDERLFDPHFRSKSTEFEIEISTTMTNRKYFAGIEDVLRRTKIISFLACPIFLGAFMQKVNSRSQPALACLYGVLSVDCLRMSYNCYSRNYCAIGLRQLGNDGNVIKISSTVFER